MSSQGRSRGRSRVPTIDVPVYNPLDYPQLARNLIRELMNQPPHSLPLSARFEGAGVYALFYTGSFSLYQHLATSDLRIPIYVGKAVPGGARKGKTKTPPSKSPLYNRIGEHVRSIKDATSTLSIQDFLCRYLVVEPLWITLAERFLIEDFQPLWNVGLEGFGDHPPGRGRHAGEIPWWDALHPGRSWAKKLQQTRDESAARKHVEDFLELQRTRPKELARIIEQRLAEEGLDDISEVENE